MKTKIWFFLAAILTIIFTTLLGSEVYSLTEKWAEVAYFTITAFLVGGLLSMCPKGRLVAWGFLGLGFAAMILIKAGTDPLLVMERGEDGGRFFFTAGAFLGEAVSVWMGFLFLEEKGPEPLHTS